MLPHPDTISVLAEQRRRELLDSVARQRLVRRQAPFRLRPTALRLSSAIRVALLGVTRSRLHGLRGAAKLGRSTPPAA